MSNIIVLARASSFGSSEQIKANNNRMLHIRNSQKDLERKLSVIESNGDDREVIEMIIMKLELEKGLEADF
ncbi:MAG: hypothetical protein M1829_000200 [Trizodia sp. TS-e1964]|nr:MAG: hypothetical protein M1829_000200 [Trizodia sp. TS-e1964]